MYKVEVDFGEEDGWWTATFDKETQVAVYILDALAAADEEKAFKVVVTVTKEVHGK